MEIIHFSVWSRTFTQFRFELLKALQKIGVNNLLVCSYEKFHSDKLREKGFELIEYDYSKSIDRDLFKSIVNLRRIMRSSTSHFIFMHQPMALLIGVISSLFLKKKLVYFTGGLKANDSMGFFKKTITTSMELLLLSRCELILSVNHEDNDFLNKVFSSKSVYVGPRGGCGIDTKKFIFDERKKLNKIEYLDIDNDSIIIGMIGRIEKEKGVFQVLDTFISNNNKKLHLVFIGSGSEDDTLIQLIEALPQNIQSRVHFLGRQEKIHEWYSIIDVFVLSSLREGMPVSLLEAMSSSCLVLSTNVRGAREAIKNKVNGFIFEDTHTLCASLINIANNVDKHQLLRDNARTTVINDYSSKVLLPKTLHIIDSHINNSYE